jgi:serine/threonine protein kinase
MKTCPKCHGAFDDALSTCPEDALELVNSGCDPLIGQLFAEQYEIISVLGKGGMSVVYKARHKLMDRIVAIKLLQGDADELAMARFKLEAKAASSLNHPNIITVYDFGIINKQAYLVMDCLEGVDLEEVLQKEGRLPFDRAVRIFRQVCEGLEHAHSKGIVHRDLKPSNLCLIKGEYGAEQVKIVDFGIAKILSEPGKQKTELTQTGAIFGTPLYMSPEQCLSQPLDIRSDIYSLGCVMYESLTGVPPHAGDTPFSTMTRHINLPAPPFEKAAPDIHINKNMEAIVFRCLEKKREERYQTAAEILADLPRILPTSGSLKVVGVVHPAKQRQEMAFLRSGFWGLLLFVGLIFTYMATDHGPNHDRGTVLEKTIWNSQTTVAQTLIDWQLYPPAEAVLASCESTAKARFSNRGRLMTALLLQRDLFKKANMFEKLDKIDAKIAELNKQILIDSYDSSMEELHQLSSYKTQTQKNVNMLMGVVVLSKIQHVGRALNGNLQDERAETLLSSAKKVYSDLFGKDDRSIADIDMLLADCYFKQQRLRKVRPLLLEAATIYEKTKGLNDKSTIIAIARLGQFDRNENNYAIAEQELLKSQNAADKFFPEDKYLRSLIKKPC